MNEERRTEQTRATSLNELREYAKGALIELPPFGPGQPFFAMVKRPSIMQLASENEIPNPLLETANRIFIFDDPAAKEENVKDKELMNKTMELLKVFAKVMLLEPTYDDIKMAGLDLTDEQLLTLYNYAQIGVNALDSFRTEPEDREGVGSM